MRKKSKKNEKRVRKDGRKISINMKSKVIFIEIIRLNNTMKFVNKAQLNRKKIGNWVIFSLI